MKNLLSAKEALNKLIEGNKNYVAEGKYGEASPAIREKNKDGQSPFAVIVACSDSRVIPEYIFSAGIGEVFAVRVAGNVIGPEELGSIEYATSHLGVKLVVILGHTGCGAVSAAVEGGGHGYIKILTDRIKDAIGEEKDKEKACAKNVLHVVQTVNRAQFPDVTTVGAIYDIVSGEVSLI